MIVVDASVAVKWFVPEKDSEKAEQLLLSRKQLIAPELIRIEVAATFTRLQRMSELASDKVSLALGKWRTYLEHEAVSLEDMRTHLQLAEQLSIELSHPLQDCLYLAVAHRFNISLITADTKFLKKAQPAGYDVVAL